MNSITKERIELFIKNPLENGLTRGEQMELARIALASLAAVSDERAAYELFMEKRFGESVDRRRAKNGDREYMAWDMALGWIIWCHRAAMLQAEPVSNSDELPLDYLQGHKDGLEWAAQLAEANHPQTGDWLYDDPIDLARAIRKGPDMPTVQGGNSPVTPDGWISCSERMPEMGERQCYVLAADFKNNYPPNIPNTQVGVYGDWFNDGNPTWDDGDGEDLYLKEVTHWMPLPEPPQEVNRG